MADCDEKVGRRRDWLEWIALAVFLIFNLRAILGHTSLAAGDSLSLYIIDRVYFCGIVMVALLCAALVFRYGLKGLRAIPLVGWIVCLMFVVEVIVRLA